MPAQPTMSEERIKRIEITVDREGKPHIPAGQRAITLDSKKEEEVIWVSEVPFRIDFGGDSPFYEGEFNHVHRRSGLVKRGVIPSQFRHYEYTIEIEGKTLDPKIFVFP